MDKDLEEIAYHWVSSVEDRLAAWKRFLSAYPEVVERDFNAFWNRHKHRRHHHHHPYDHDESEEP